MIIGWLTKADKELFYIINQQLNWLPINNIMLILRQPFTWIPAYLFFLLFFFTNCRRYIVPIVLLSMLTFALTDFTSATILKPFIGRLRPCHDPSIPFIINNPAGCGGLFSMPSSHASNHFGLSTLWFLIIRHTLSRNWYWLFLWAFIIGYSQVYVGVHFPGDILTGALLGISVGALVFLYFKKWIASIDKNPLQNINA